jgi:hypothetical protein
LWAAKEVEEGDSGWLEQKASDLAV